MKRRSERIKVRCETTAVQVPDTNQATDVAPVSSKPRQGRSQRKSTTSALSGEKSSSNTKRTNASLAGHQKSEEVQPQARRRKITTDDKEDSNATEHPVKVFRGMRGKLRQLTEFPLDILFEVCPSISRRNLAIMYDL
jgi:hypothetical protein